MTSPLIQLNFEIEAFREAVRGTLDGKKRLARALKSVVAPYRIVRKAQKNQEGK